MKSIKFGKAYWSIPLWAKFSLHIFMMATISHKWSAKSLLKIGTCGKN